MHCLGAHLPDGGPCDVRGGSLYHRGQGTALPQVVADVMGRVVGADDDTPAGRALGNHGVKIGSSIDRVNRVTTGRTWVGYRAATVHDACGLSAGDCVISMLRLWVFGIWDY